MGWYDDDSLGGFEKFVEKMIGNDLNFGMYYDIFRIYNKYIYYNVI